MDDRFEAIVWWLNQEMSSGGKITMDVISEGLKAYNQYLDEIANVKSRESAGESPPLAGRVKVGRATLYRDFGTVENVMERTYKYLEGQGLPVPNVLREFLAADRRARKATLENQARPNGDASPADLDRSVEKARAAHNDEELVLYLEQLAALYLKEEKKNSAEAEKNLVRAFRAAKEGYDTAKESAKRAQRGRMMREQMLCARSAAWAMVQMSRLKVGPDPTASMESVMYLSRAVTWKRNEEEIAKALKLPTTARVARFHADYGDALLDDDLEQMIIGLSDISMYLWGNGGAEADDRVRYHDLTYIIHRLCAIEWASAEDEALETIVKKHFPVSADIHAVIKELRGIYSRAGRGFEGRRDVEALVAVRDVYHEIRQAYEHAKSPVESSDLVADGERSGVPATKTLSDIISKVEPVTFMRMSELTSLHALAFAYVAIAAYDLEKQQEEWAEEQGKGFPAANELLTTASNLCSEARKKTWSKGVSRVILQILERAQEGISERLSAEEFDRINDERRRKANRTEHDLEAQEKTGRTKNPVYQALLNDVNDMAWKTMTMSPLTHKEAVDLARVLRDIDRYLMGSYNLSQDKGIRNDLA